MCARASVILTGGRTVGLWMLTPTDKPPWMVHHGFKWRCCSVSWGFQKYTVTDTHPPPPPPPYTNTQRRHSEKAQADPPCVLLLVTHTCFCGFYRQLHTNMSRIATLSDSEHCLFVRPQQCVGRIFSHTPHCVHLLNFIFICDSQGWKASKKCTLECV